MAIEDIVISKANLIIYLIMLLLLSSSIVIFYLVSKKIRQKTKETSEYKNMMKFLDKQKVKTVSVKADKEVKPEKEEIKFWNPMKSMSKRSFAYWKAWFLEKYFPGQVILISMELTNGFWRLFTVKEKEEGFEFRGKKYLFDDDNKFYNIDAKLYQFRYHESLVLPIKEKIPVGKIKKTLESTEGIDIEYAINPSTLQRFMTAKIAEGVMKGTQIDEFMRKLQMFLMVTMITALVHLALFLYASGILQNLKVPNII